MRVVPYSVVFPVSPACFEADTRSPETVEEMSESGISRTYGLMPLLREQIEAKKAQARAWLAEKSPELVLRDACCQSFSLEGDARDMFWKLTLRYELHCEKKEEAAPLEDLLTSLNAHRRI